MKISPSCEACILRQQEDCVAAQPQETREAYMAAVRKAMKDRQADDSAPYMVSCFNRIYRTYFGECKHYTDLKNEYNDLVLSMEDALMQRIRASADPLLTALLFARVGNYIDFAALSTVDKTTFIAMFDTVQASEGDCTSYQNLCAELEHAKSFLLLCDNCGEVVLDKLFLRILKERYPQLMIRAMVRGGEALNDVTMEDALYVGLDQVAELISNGTDIAGTDVQRISNEARRVLEEADIVFSKGQGNYESLNGCSRPVYYAFLCKCEYFTRTFQVPQYTGMLFRAD